MPPENPQGSLDSSVTKTGVSKTQAIGLITIVGGTVYALTNVGEHGNVHAISAGGCATVLLGVLTTLVGTIMRPGNTDISANQDTISEDPADDLTGEEAMQLEALYRDNEQS